MRLQESFTIDVSFNQENLSSGGRMNRISYGGVEIRIVDSVDIDSHYYSAFEISATADYRQVSQNLYKMALVSPNELMMMIPALNESFLKNHEELWDLDGHDELYCEQTRIAHRTTSFIVKEEKHQQIRVLLFSFPKYISLSNSYYSPKLVAENNGEVQGYFRAIEETYKSSSGLDVEVSFTRAVFCVHVNNKNAPQSRPKRATSNEALQTLEESLHHMRIGRQTRRHTGRNNTNADMVDDDNDDDL